MPSRCVRRPSLRRPIESKVRATFSDFGVVPVAALIAGRERAQTGDDRAGIGGGRLFSRLIANGEGSRVVCGAGLFLNSFSQTVAHGGVP